jgi:hypothetical protein
LTTHLAKPVYVMKQCRKIAIALDVQEIR